MVLLFSGIGSDTKKNMSNFLTIMDDIVSSEAFADETGFESLDLDQVGDYDPRSTELIYTYR